MAVTVQCAACGEGLADAAKFCFECGAPVPQATCRSCGVPVGAGRFCSECGASYGQPAPPQTASPAPPTAVPVAERRLTSILFGDLVGFTELSQSRDPEDVRELLSRYFERSRKVVQRYGGTVEKFIGDAVMAVWGVPAAHEDDAERCVRAGLDLVDLVTALGEELGAPLALRVGIVTGEVAVTLGASNEGMVAGDAVNTASRVQTVAEPGTVWVDEATRGLTAAAVAYVAVGEHALKGKAEPVRLHQARSVIAAVGGAQRVDGLEAPFTGRDRELRLVKELFQATVEDGRPRMVLISGMAGAGKSRIGWEFEKYADGLQGLVRWHRGRCLSYGEGVAFWALGEMVRSRLGLTEGDSGEVTTERLDAALSDFVPSERDRTWLRGRLAVLLGAENRAYPREELFAAWTVFLERVSEGCEGLVLLLEDLQHADDGLLDFVDHALATARFPLFVLGLARPELQERRPAVGTGRRSTTMHLEPLSDRAMGDLVDGLVDSLPGATRQALVARAEGVPLYAVETVRALIDRDAVVPVEGRYVLAPDAGERVDLLTLGAPASLQALISSRLDALEPPERALVQDAAVLGTSFTRSGLVALGRDADGLEPLLQALVRKEIVALQNDPRSTERGQFTFVQSVVRQVAYDTLSRRDRKSRHLAVAAHLTNEPDPGDDLAAVIAQHHLDALDASSPGDDDIEELTRLAGRTLLRAAERSLTLGSPVEAVRHYAAALELLRRPASHDDGEVAVVLQRSARAALAAGRLDTAAAHARQAMETFDRLDNVIDAAHAAVLLGVALWHGQELLAAVALLAPRVATLEGIAGGEVALLETYEALGRTYNALGDTEQARRCTERTLLLAEELGDHDRLVSALTTWAIIWTSSGSPTAGLALLTKAVELGRQHHLRAALVRPLLNICAFNIVRDVELACQAGREGTELAEQTGNLPMRDWCAMNLALALWTSGRWAELVALLDRNLANRPNPIAVTYVLSARLAAATGEPPPRLPPEAIELTHGEDIASRCWGLAASATDEAAPQERAALSADAVRAAKDTAGFEDDFVHFWGTGVEDALAAGRFDEARQLIDLVAGARPGLLPPLVSAHLPRLQGLLGAAEGRLDDAAAALGAGAQQLAGFGAPFWAAQSELALAEVLQRQGEGEAAVALLDRCEAAFAGLGATPWTARVSELRAEAMLRS